MAANDDDKQFLLMVGRNLEREFVLQVYDLEDDEWYSERKIFDKESCDGIGRSFCVIGTKLYYTVKVSSDEGSPEAKIFGFSFFSDEHSTKNEICSFDLLTNEIVNTGATFKSACDVKFVPVDDNIYFLASTENALWCYATKENNLSICTEVSDMYLDDCISSTNGNIYLLGERMMRQHTEGEKYDPQTKELTTIAASPHVCTYRSAMDRLMKCTGLNGKIYAVNIDSLAMIFVYTPEEDKWETISVKNEPLFSRGCLTACNGRLIAACTRCFIYIYDFESNEWECLRDYNGSMITCQKAISVSKSSLINFLN